MKVQDKNTIDERVKLIYQEVNGNPYQKFNLAFSLMSVIPFLVFFYLLAINIVTFNFFVGNTGLIIFISIFISLCGFCVGYHIIKNILKKAIFYAIQAKHSDQLKSTFVATVSHELKNPLSVIKMNLFNMLIGVAGQINDTQKQTLEVCRNVIDRMTRLINDFLDIYKIEAGMVEIKRKLFNFVEIVEKQIKEFEVKLNEKRIKLLKEALNNDIAVWADEDKIMQVVNNLLSNAIKHTSEEGKIILKIFPTESFVRLECIDTGPGIPDDKINKIFDKFGKLNIDKEGTGLGLSITKDIVEMHKGKIWVESQLGKGSKFIVVLPKDLRQTRRL